MAEPLILASSSIYKKMLLERLNISFTCESPNTNEQPLPNETPKSLAIRLAKEKALAVLATNPSAIVIGTDQVGELNGTIVGKPGNFDQARHQLAQQSGQTVYFHSAVSVVKTLASGEIANKSTINTTRVVFKQLSIIQIENYLHQEKPFDCAGSFKSEGFGISLFSSINSDDPTSLVGLPLISLYSMLEEYGLTASNNTN
ncbi:MAG: Maf family nucleotide pyrophosphatase [Porticoccaceae bacterium]|nr:Maf family nucleotide pyrophosphatase [Porticoccaceae bacterium]